MVTAVSLLTAFFLPAAETIVAYSGLATPTGVVGIDADSLSAVTGTITQGYIPAQDMAVDGNGRLYGFSISTLSEYDPVSLTALRSVSLGNNLNGLAAHNGVLYMYSQGPAAAHLLAFDAGDFSLIAGTPGNSRRFGQDLAFNESGRLFGVSGHTLFEYDPVSLAVLRSAGAGGGIQGLAARNGILYSYSGDTASPGLITFDADSFSLLSGTLSSSIIAGQDLTFSGSGRLFGSSRGVVREYDPATLEILHSAPFNGALHGLAIVPEPGTALLAALGAVRLLGRSRGKRPA
ncbi:MAG: hypothetical protein JWM59_1446 [Verrucomicrobiales bacterium]|nr:hypothetical protein [Verrucomicrobiales bacterium]